MVVLGLFQMLNKLSFTNVIISSGNIKNLSGRTQPTMIFTHLLLVSAGF